MFKARSIKEIEKIIQEKNLCLCYFKKGSFYFAFETLEQFRIAYKSLKKQ